MRALPWIALILSALLPLSGSGYLTTVGTGILTFAMLGLGLNIVVGFAGLLDLGYAAFFAIGAYTTALLTTRLGFTVWEAFPFSMGLAALAGAILGWPTLRLRSDYLAIVTLGFGEIVRQMATNLDFTGGPDGVWGIPRPSVFGLRLDDAAMYWLALALVLLTLHFTRNLARSRLGRAWLALREDESAAEAVGVPVVRVKLMAYVMGALWGGLAGTFFAGYIGVINPQSFTYMQSVLVLMVVVLGGMASLPGVLVGALVVQGLPELLRSVSGVLSSTSAAGGIRLLIFAIGLVALMLLRPQGIWPASRRWQHALAAVEAVGPDPAASPTDLAAIDAPLGENGALLRVEGLEKRFGGLRAVAGVSFDIRRGEIFSVIGPNGAGKTTVFNLVTGVVKADAGSATLGGRRLTGLAPHQTVRFGLARTFQGIRLFRGMTAMENVLVGMHARQRASVLASLVHSPAERREETRSVREAHAWLAFVGLAERADQLAGQLAYGDQRRLEIARALASRPTVLLLDEPAAGMNPSEKRDLMALVRRIRDLGVTVVLIEHDMELVMNVSDRVLVLDRGQAIAQGRPADIRADRRVIEAYLGGDDAIGRDTTDREAVGDGALGG